MIETVAKLILLSFIIFYVIDFSLHAVSEYNSFPFKNLRKRYHTSKFYYFYRKTGIWGGAGMFCPGTRVRYFHYVITNENNKTLLDFPHYKKLPYPLQIWYFRWRRLGYVGIQHKKSLIRNFAIQNGVRNKYKLFETVYHSQYMDYDGTIVPAKVRKYITRWPSEKKTKDTGDSGD
tara:strand:- start:1909 stop:2436 length:528 start_codon:yes stop_codon:yes gene_type:complete